MSTVPSNTGYAHIVHPTDGGEPSIDGTRIRVRDVAIARTDDGLSPEEIVNEAYPSLTLAQVYAALAYFEDHREEMALAAAAEHQRMEQLKSDHPERVIDCRAPTE